MKKAKPKSNDGPPQAQKATEEEDLPYLPRERLRNMYDIYPDLARHLCLKHKCLPRSCSTSMLQSTRVNPDPVRHLFLKAQLFTPIKAQVFTPILFDIYASTHKCSCSTSMPQSKRMFTDPVRHLGFRPRVYPDLVRHLCLKVSVYPDLARRQCLTILMLKR